MQKKTVNNIRLGFFVLVATTFLIAALYLIGNNRNLFDSTFTVKATFFKVNGLMKGNNVRFSGIDVGTVKSVQIASDSSVEVTMIIESEARKFIRKNAVASIGTDGLMGNKLVEIDNTREPGESVEDGDVITTRRPIETDQMLRTLERTNNDLSEITRDLKEIARKVNHSDALWNILGDSVMARDVKQSIKSIETATRNASAFTRDLNDMMLDLRKGKGMINYLVYDTVAPKKLDLALRQIDSASDNASIVAMDLKEITARIKRGEGAAGAMMTDSLFARDLNETMRNVREGSAKLNENMEAMRHNFLFRGYFKKQEKEEKKAREAEEKKKQQKN
jgi:phospholipid/cholesterol/gamma-HCH transport system substrate-binding protein